MIKAIKESYNVQDTKLKKWANEYRLSYKLLYQQASDALRAKLMTIKDCPDSALANDADVKKFIADVINLSEGDL